MRYFNSANRLEKESLFKKNLDVTDVVIPLNCNFFILLLECVCLCEAFLIPCLFFNLCGIKGQRKNLRDLLFRHKF